VAGWTDLRTRRGGATRTLSVPLQASLVPSCVSFINLLSQGEVNSGRGGGVDGGADRPRMRDIYCMFSDEAQRVIAQWRRKLVVRRYVGGTEHEERKVHRKGEDVRREHDWSSRTSGCGDWSQREDSRVAIYIPRLP
jgi:hypothetical protein